MRRNSSKRGWGFLVLEFIIVFVSVSGAFYVDTLKEDRRVYQNQIKFYETFLMNLNVQGMKADQLINAVDSLIFNAENADEIQYAEVDFSSNQLIIRSAFESNYFEAITPEFLRNLDEGSNLITRLDKTVDRLNQRVDAYQLGLIEERNFEKWYVSELKHIRSLAQTLSGVINGDSGAAPSTKALLERLKE